MNYGNAQIEFLDRFLSCRQALFMLLKEVEHVVMVLFSYLAITHIKSAISAKTLGHSIRITTLPSG
ncbi:hypothetical protein CE161_05585 [Bifidobacterium longum]|nr:hypothetical protein CE161_05585 [Bifidobacterium longum]